MTSGCLGAFRRRGSEIESWQVPENFCWPIFRDECPGVPDWAWEAMERATKEWSNAGVPVVAPRVLGPSGWQVFKPGDWLVRDGIGARPMHPVFFAQMYVPISDATEQVNTGLSDYARRRDDLDCARPKIKAQMEEQQKLHAAGATTFAYALLKMQNNGKAFRRSAWGGIWRMTVANAHFTMEARVAGIRVYLNHPPSVEDQLATDWEEVTV